MKMMKKFLVILPICLFVFWGISASTGICGDYIEDLRKAAEKGDAEAQKSLGLAYTHGIFGVPEDFAEAARWYHKAAEQGDSQAQYRLGFIYLFGRGVLKSAAESVKWFRKAAEQGNTEAQYLLGDAYAMGEGVPKNLAEAVKWYRKAAEQGDASAQYELGWAYYDGEGVPKNLAEAVKWYRKAAEQGIANAQYQLGWVYAKGEGVPKDYIKAVKWYRKAAEQGDAKAQIKLGALYSLGRGVPKNAAESVKWFRKAAEQGNADAQYSLALNYAIGDGVLKDEIEALAWLNIAAASGDPKTVKFRKSLESQLGQQASLFAQQRSKEILKEIESTKQFRAKTERDYKRSETSAELRRSGTGVIVSSNGIILTAAHVVGQSTDIRVATQHGVKVALVAKLDNANDLALLKCEGSFQAAPVKFSSGIKLGQSVFTIGFPNIGFQGFSPKMTKGEINSLSGLQDDPRHWQISAPVQPGNSGGPLFDEAGNVIGVVLSKLDAMRVAKFTGDLPQNVNYAVKGIYALPLLEPYAANLASENAASTSPKMLESVVEKVQGAVVLILVY